MASTPLLSVSKGYNLERGFAAVYVDPSSDMAATADALEAAPEVAGSIPVMIDEHGASRYFLPDELTVQFRPGVSKETAVRIIEEQGSRIVVEQRTPGYYTVAVPDGRRLVRGDPGVRRAR